MYITARIIETNIFSYIVKFVGYIIRNNTCSNSGVTLPLRVASPTSAVLPAGRTAVRLIAAAPALALQHHYETESAESWQAAAIRLIGAPVRAGWSHYESGPARGQPRTSIVTQRITGRCMPVI